MVVGRVEVGMAEANLLEHFYDVGDDRAAPICAFLFVECYPQAGDVGHLVHYS